ncbi:MAG TPA: M23 family metallopeptidase [Mobilitalea sp.]|nr:M23 family metallopeptidase [Mobilitalea sp.]
MKKNKFTEFFKGKGYYVLLFVGVVAIAAVAIIGSNLTSDQDNEGDDFISLNEPEDNIVEEYEDQLLTENNQTSDDLANNVEDSNVVADVADQNVTDNDSLIEFDVYTKEEEEGINLAEANEPENTAAAEEIEEEPEAVETTGNTVEADTSSILESLSFTVDEGLLWPVNGNVIMNYSMDHTIYHATLMQFKCNPAIIIDAEVGTEVKAAADGIISSIDVDEETGLTVTTDIGNGYSLVYGQLAEEGVLEVGDVLKEGDVLGTVNEPTRYYSVEGSNLYFSVLQEDATVNPMLYLR